MVVKDLNEAKALEKYILKQVDLTQFYDEFKGQYSINFNVETDFDRIGVVNQTTMLASDTQEIADYLKAIVTQYESTDLQRFADTKDTLCYATNDNQSAVVGLLETEADLAIVVGGYNSSNTSHLVELCEQKLPTYFIENELKILSNRSIQHYLIHDSKEIITPNFLPAKEKVKVLITSGASCPDAVVEAVIHKLLDAYPESFSIEKVQHEILNG